MIKKLSFEAKFYSVKNTGNTGFTGIPGFLLRINTGITGIPKFIF